MYPVSVPAAACDLPPDCEPDKTNLPATKADLKLVEIRKPETAPSPGEEAPASQGLAAKILQMHAAAETAGPGTVRKSGLTDPHEARVLEIPEVPQRPSEEDDLSRPAPEAEETAAIGYAFSRPPRKRTGNKALTIAALAVLACGGGALALSMTGLLERSESGTHEVETQLITTEPTIESLITEDAAGQDAALPGLAAADTTATAGLSDLQIARAKEQLREAFAARGISSQATLDPSSAEASAEAQESKIQARMATPQPEEAPSAVSSTAPASPVTASVDTPAPVEPAGEIQQARSGTEEIPVPPEEPAEGPAAVAQQPDVQAKPGRQSTPAAQAMQEAPPLLDDQGAPPVVTGLSSTGRIVSSVNLRQSASKNSSVLGVIPANSEVRFGDCGTWWCNVLYDGKSGYVGKNFLKETSSN